MKRPSDVIVVERFAPLRTQLLELLTGLSEEDWAHSTTASRWTVKDVALHLLGGDIGILSRERDEFRPPAVHLGQYSELVELVNRLNAEWVVAARRMSTRLLCELLAFTGPEVEAWFASLDLYALGGPVSWAGPDPAPVWLDVAREFTERWHHQQQIRDATGRASLYDPDFFSPVLNTFVRALPHNFRNVDAPEGATVKFEMTGEAGSAWLIIRGRTAWHLACDDSVSVPDATVIIPQETAWRMFTKGVDSETARASAVTSGDARLALPIFGTVSVIG